MLRRTAYYGKMSVISLVTDLSASVGELRSEITEMNTRLSSQVSELSFLTAALDSKIVRIGSCIPAYSAAAVRDFVVVDGNGGEKAMLSGDIATYTYVRHGARYFALGAGHCAFYYPPPYTKKVKGKGDALRFVCLPLGLTKIAKSVLTAAHISSVRATDFVAIELKHNPLPVEPPQWPVPFSQACHGGHSVYGWANSGYIGGHALVNDHVNGTLSFIEERGEAGQSGALLYSSHTHEPLGVYFGTREQSAATALTPRGQIVPLPHPDTLTCHEIKRTPKRRFDYWTQSGPYSVKWVEKMGATALLDEGQWQAGVFIGHCSGVAFHGAKVCGSCRPAPLPTDKK